jgi:hypothetical protein
LASSQLSEINRFCWAGLKNDLERSREETEERSLQLQETLAKLETVRATLMDAKEVNSYKAKELKEKVITRVIQCCHS